MNTKNVKVSFTEQSKAMTASVHIEYIGEDVPSNDKILEETKDLYREASKFSGAVTMQRARQ